jgi:hypothetical protein
MSAGDPQPVRRPATACQMEDEPPLLLRVPTLVRSHQPRMWRNQDFSDMRLRTASQFGWGMKSPEEAMSSDIWPTDFRLNEQRISSEAR